MHRGVIFNLQRYSVQDGPGIRTTVFLKGCPLRCKWCHNPEGIRPEREILVLETRCLGCGECRRVCPLGSEAAPSGPLPTGDARCRLCGKCVDACPAQARQMAGREVKVPELLQEVLRDRVFYEESGGGVTFSGGEPLAQPEFLVAMLRACKESGMHTTVDTCGFASTRHVMDAAKFADLFLYDLKLMDEQRHRTFTGASNRLILGNLKALAGAGKEVWIRIPVIPGVNDSAGDMETAARFVRGIGAVRQVNLLPYHRNGVAKARRAGRETSWAAPATPASAELMRRAAGIFETQGINARIGG